MIQKFVDVFMENRETLRSSFLEKEPGSYGRIVDRVVRLFSEMDPDRITVIDHGDYQGTQLYIIGAEGYQPSNYWAIMVSYGSCSGCDTFEAIRDEELEKRIDWFMTLALHIVQDIKEI